MTPQQFHAARAWQRLGISGIYTVPFGLTLWGATVPGFVGWAMIIMLLLWNFAMVGNALAMLWQTEALQSAASDAERRVERLEVENANLRGTPLLVAARIDERAA